jgi:hypothetical protein
LRGQREAEAIQLSEPEASIGISEICTAIDGNRRVLRRFYKGPRITRNNANFGGPREGHKANEAVQENPSLPVSASLALLPSVNGFHSEIRVNSRVSRASTFGCGCAALGNPRLSDIRVCTIND